MIPNNRQQTIAAIDLNKFFSDEMTRDVVLEMRRLGFRVSGLSNLRKLAAPSDFIYVDKLVLVGILLCKKLEKEHGEASWGNNRSVYNE